MAYLDPLCKLSQRSNQGIRSVHCLLEVSLGKDLLPKQFSLLAELISL